jgi:hypothetical protein
MRALVTGSLILSSPTVSACVGVANKIAIVKGIALVSSKFGNNLSNFIETPHIR